MERGAYSEQIPETAIHAGEKVEFATRDMKTVAQLEIYAIMNIKNKKLAICENIDQTPKSKRDDRDYLEEFKRRSREWIYERTAV